MKRFGNLTVKAAAFVLVIGAIWLMAYAVRDHYRMAHHCQCPLVWEWFPFLVSGFALMFAMALLSKAATQGAANVILPFASMVVERLGRRSTDPVATVTTPAPAPTITPHAAPADDEDKP